MMSGSCRTSERFRPPLVQIWAHSLMIASQSSSRRPRESNDCMLDLTVSLALRKSSSFFILAVITAASDSVARRCLCSSSYIAPVAFFQVVCCMLELITSSVLREYSALILVAIAAASVSAICRFFSSSSNTASAWATLFGAPNHAAALANGDAERYLEFRL